MKLNHLTDSELIAQTEKVVKSERKMMHIVLCHIAEMEARKLYADLGFDSMYSYLTKSLGYCETSAYSRWQGARLLRKLPEAVEKIESGALKLSQLTQVQKCLKQHEQSSGKVMAKADTMQILAKIENQTSHQTQKTLAQEFQFPIQVQEKVKPQKDESVRLEITLTHEQFQELKQAKDLLSHVCADGSWSSVISYLARTHNKKKLIGRIQKNKTIDGKAGVEKGAGLISSDESPKNEELAHDKNFDAGHLSEAKISKDKGLYPNKNFATAKLRVKRSTIKITTQRLLLANANGCCEYQDTKTGRKCESRYQLQVDHIVPLAMGGSNDPKNFRILCRTHNLLAARRAGVGTL